MAIANIIEPGKARPVPEIFGPALLSGASSAFAGFRAAFADLRVRRARRFFSIEIEADK
jgi:hypothetical protein